jgi:hypothetical protein
MWTPHTVLLERDLSIVGYLRRGWRRCAGYNRPEQQTDRDSDAGYEGKNRAAYPPNGRHDLFLCFSSGSDSRKVRQVRHAG